MTQGPQPRGNTGDVKLRGSGQIINMSRFPDSIVDVLFEVFQREPDPYTVLAGYAYIFSGLCIDEIRALFVLTDFNKTRLASREYIRQKIKNLYVSIRDVYHEKYGEMDVSTVHGAGQYVVPGTGDYGTPIARLKEDEGTSEGSENEENEDEELREFLKTTVRKKRPAPNNKR